MRAAVAQAWAERDDHTDALPEMTAALRHYHAKVLAAMREVELVRFHPEAALAAAVELERIERAVEAAEGVER